MILSETAESPFLKQVVSSLYVQEKHPKRLVCSHIGDLHFPLGQHTDFLLCFETQMQNLCRIRVSGVYLLFLVLIYRRYSKPFQSQICFHYQYIFAFISY